MSIHCVSKGFIPKFIDNFLGTYLLIQISKDKWQLFPGLQIADASLGGQLVKNLITNNL